MASKIRQNPTVSSPTGGLQICPEHGSYKPPPDYYEMKDRARQKGVEPGVARRLLRKADEARRACPDCVDLAPTWRQWLDELHKKFSEHPMCPGCGGRGWCRC